MAQAHPGSSAIVLNQLGFLTSGSKRAVLQSSARESLPWVLKDEDARIVLEGRTEVFGRDEASGTSVHRIDLSAYAVPSAGLVLEVCGQISRPFAIADATYTNLAEDALRYFYHNRIGTPIEARFAGGEAWARPPALEGLRASCFAGKDRFGNDWPGCAYTLSVEGSWYDAGDFGVYPVNLGISVWTLQSAFERLQTRGLVQAAGWDDGRLALPETGNGVSELLDEARWGMESLLRLQIPDGQTAAIAPGAQTPDKTGRLRIASADVGGMVHHKLAGLTWPPLPVMPQDADARRFLYPPSTAATLSLAATAAQSARLWQGKDDAFAERCLLAAQRAWQAALRHPDILAYDNFDGSGGYGDSNLKDEFAWAAWELHLTTGEASYRDAFDTLQGGAPFAGRPDNFGWADKSLLPALSAAHSGLALPDAPRAQLLAAADAALRIADKTGYRVPLGPTEYEWGSNSQVLNRAIILATAFDLTGAEPYRDGVIDAMDYLLGRNVLGQSFVSGYGERAMRAPHHRIWGGAVDARFPLPPPGALSGGPNANAMADPVAQAMKGKCAPQACWVDDVGAYSLNEVAINWNAPLVWATVFLDQTSRTSR
jgi:endoglucanase